jgi:hypothetical protein
MKWYHRLFLAFSLFFGAALVTNMIAQRDDMISFSLAAFGFCMAMFVALPNDLGKQ